MDLTPEERNRIYQEEKARLEAQGQIKREQERADKEVKSKKTQQGCLGCLGLLLVLFIIGSLIKDEKPTGVTSTSSTSSSYTDLKASVLFNQRQFTISNLDSFDWANVKLEINYGLISSGYELRTPLIKAGQTYTVGAMQFTKSDGTRFNPFKTKAQKLSIFCTTPKGQGSYFATWE